MTAIAPIVGAFYVCTNTLAVGLFYYDKQQAIHQKWRVPERNLITTAAIGGWIGGIIAMQKFHHKNKKREFLVPYGVATLLNIAGTAAIAVVLARRGVNLNTKIKDARYILGF
jgi:uncharacterized membrane protein YsdA (DUF1294 family)